MLYFPKWPANAALLALLCCLAGFTARADYRYMSLSALVAKADYGIIGTIIKLDTNYFWVKAERGLTGHVPNQYNRKSRRPEGPRLA